MVLREPDTVLYFGSYSRLEMNYWLKKGTVQARKDKAKNEARQKDDLTFQTHTQVVLRYGIGNHAQLNYSTGRGLLAPTLGNTSRLFRFGKFAQGRISSTDGFPKVSHEPPITVELHYALGEQKKNFVIRIGNSKINMTADCLEISQKKTSFD